MACYQLVSSISAILGSEKGVTSGSFQHGASYVIKRVGTVPLNDKGTGNIYQGG